MKKFILLLVVVGMFFAFQTVEIALAKDAGNIISVDANYWLTTFSSDLKITDLGLIGTEIDVVDDLGVDDSESVPTISATLNILRSHRLAVSYFNIKNEGQKIINKTIDYNGRTYTVGSNVSSKLDLTVFEGYYEWMLLKEDFGEAGFIIGAKYAQIDSELKDNTAGVTKSEAIEGPCPIIGVQGEVKLPFKLSVAGVLKGMALNVGDVDFKLLDLEADLNYDFNRFLRATVGYRYMLVDGEDGQDSAKVTYGGPVVGITGSF